MITRQSDGGGKAHLLSAADRTDRAGSNHAAGADRPPGGFADWVRRNVAAFR
ncbi:hypothetical protein [Jiangella asiatica]|uniref:hypothetical protein n=1 Tax=Jiangella asiatica TaxID=2530372 RepID=UPI0013A5CF83|nr:hypothetical protein [Jiangella asiatica]